MATPDPGTASNWPTWIGGAADPIELDGFAAPEARQDAARPPAFEILTRRLRLIPSSPEYAESLRRALDASSTELRRWMLWARTFPHPVEQHITTLRNFRAQFERDEAWSYLCFERPDGEHAAQGPSRGAPSDSPLPRSAEIVGSIGLHQRVGPGALEIGYWIRSDRTGRGLATEAAGALTRLAIEVHAMSRVEIRVAVGNAASSAVPRKLGYSLEAVLPARIPMPGEDGGETLADAEVWTLHRHQLNASPAAGVVVEAFDAVGRRLTS
jgi:RimJ/RimL family protein N-acetyltransferase